MIPGELKYTEEHEWVRLEEDEAVFGLTDYAQSELGDITFIELPEVGRELQQHESFATAESVKAASDVYAPVSGRVIKVNEALRDNPEIINQSPYEKGWICRIKISEYSDLDNLMDAAAYEKYLEGLKR